MESVMPFQFGIENKSDFQNSIKKVELTTEDNDFKNVLENKINNNSEQKEPKKIVEDDKTVEEVAEQVIKLIEKELSKDEVKLDELNLDELIAQTMKQAGIDLDTDKTKSFIEGVKLSLKEISINGINVDTDIKKVLDSKVNTDKKLDDNLDIGEIKISNSKDDKSEHKLDKELLSGLFKEKLETNPKFDTTQETKDNKFDLKLNTGIKENFNLTDIKNHPQDIINKNIETIKVEKPNDILKLVDSINISKSSKGQKIVVQLSPAELGKVNIQLTESAGKVTAKFFVEHDATKSMLLQHADAIKNQLSQKGIVVDDMQFMFSGDFNGRESFAQQSKKNFQENKFGIKDESFIYENKREIDKTGLYA
jgi:hypothetical protein